MAVLINVDPLTNAYSKSKQMHAYIWVTSPYMV